MSRHQHPVDENGPHESETDRTLDATGMICVTLLKHLRATLSTMEPGTQLTLIASDPASIYDIPAWCHLTGYDYRGYEKLGGTIRHRIVVTETRSRSTTGAVWAKPEKPGPLDDEQVASTSAPGMRSDSRCHR